MFVFVPKTDMELNAIKNQGLLAEGVYDFRVKEVVCRRSKADNEMLEVRLGVLDKNGNERVLTDWLTATDKMIFKLKHFCEAIGFDAAYAQGKIDPVSCLNKAGKLTIGIQKGNAKEDGNGYYPDRNNVRDYVKADGSASVMGLSDHVKPAPLDDVLPF